MVVYGTKELRTRSQAYDLLALAAREHWGLAPIPQVARRPDGKPYFPDAEGREFNLSHSGTLALCVLDSEPVGVDIQTVKAWRPGLPGRVCASEELAWLERQPDRWRSFSMLWALKESRAKQNGRGLRVPIRSIRVPLPREGQSLYELDGLCFRLYTGTDWIGAVCGLTPPPEQIVWSAY